MLREEATPCPCPAPFANKSSQICMLCRHPTSTLCLECLWRQRSCHCPTPPLPLLAPSMLAGSQVCPHTAAFCFGFFFGEGSTHSPCYTWAVLWCLFLCTADACVLPLVPSALHWQFLSVVGWFLPTCIQRSMCAHVCVSVCAIVCDRNVPCELLVHL